MFFSLFTHLVTETLSPKHHLHMRIINGTDAIIGEFPFMASVISEDLCGGAFISEKWLLTAAHCFYRNPITLKVYYGSNKIVSENVAKVKRYITHPNFIMGEPYPNDIALIELVIPMVFNYKTTATINLPAKNFELPQQLKERTAVIAGWGSNATKGADPQMKLQKATLKVFSDVECKKLLNGSYTTNNLCAGIDGGGKGQCRGDSGGPLVYKNNIVIGIVSWSFKPCGTLPGIFTKVSHYIDWIKENMK